MRTHAASLLLFAACSANAASFSYTGRLDDGGRPANGLYDLQLTAFPGEKAGAPLAAPVVFERVQVQDGQFRVAFDLPDAGVESAWVEVAVRATGGGGYSRIPARAKAIATPLIGQCWATTGDSGSNPATNFLGTIDTQPLAIRSANQRVALFEALALPGPAGGFSANVLQGSPENRVRAGVRGATVAGGGARSGDSEPSGLFGEGPNQVTSHYATVSGGYNNIAGDENQPAATGAFATIGGGLGNRATVSFSTIAGGLANETTADSASVGGGSVNVAAANFATVAGGTGNRAMAGRSTVVGGDGNAAAGEAATVGGGGFNCAGAALSWAGGARAKVRPDAQSGSIVASACEGVPLAPGPNGDQGTFAWADAGNTDFISNGSGRFLVRASGGLVMQKQIAAETSARQPRGYFNVVQGDSGLAQPATPRADTVASFESDTDAFLRILAPSIEEKGIAFATPESLADGGIVYLGTDVMQFRTNGNITRMSLGADGTLSLQTLGTAGATAVCRNASNQFASCSSSARYKEGIEDLGLGLAAAMQLRPVGYRWKETQAADVGFVAEEVAQLDERLVTRNAKGEIEGVKYDRLTAVLAGAVQELAAREELQRQELDRLRAEMRELKDLVRSIRARER